MRGVDLMIVGALKRYTCYERGNYLLLIQMMDPFQGTVGWHSRRVELTHVDGLLRALGYE